MSPESHEEPRTGVRPVWSGLVSFGLVSVPIDMVPATRSGDVSLRQLAPDGAPLRREYVCPTHGPLEDDDIVRAWERDDGERVVLSDDELDALAPKAGRELEIVQFVATEQLSPLLWERPYFLLPRSVALKPYRLLARVLEASARAGIASFVMRSRQHMVAILAVGGLLRAHTLRFASELRTPAQVGLPSAPAHLDPNRVEALQVLIRHHVAADLDRNELRDEIAEGLLGLADRKLAEGRDVVETPRQDAGPEPEAEIIDLMEVLRQSLPTPPPLRPPGA